MFCRFCGNEIKDSSKFCSKCGQKVQEVQEVQQVQKVQGDSLPNNGAAGKNKRIIVIVSFVLFICIALLIAYKLTNSKSGGSHSGNSDKETLFDLGSAFKSDEEAIVGVWALDETDEKYMRKFNLPTIGYDNQPQYIEFVSDGTLFYWCDSYEFEYTWDAYSLVDGKLKWMTGMAKSPTMLDYEITGNKLIIYDEDEETAVYVRADNKKDALQYYADHAREQEKAFSKESDAQYGDIKVGDIITIGSLSGKSLRWMVLNIDGSNIMLFCRDIVTTLPY